jgi:hypothetical protein
MPDRKYSRNLKMHNIKIKINKILLILTDKINKLPDEDGCLLGCCAM